METLIQTGEQVGGFLLILLAILLAITPIWFPFVLVWFVIRPLANRDIFFTTVREGAAKVVLANKQIARAMMSFRGYTFRGYLYPEGQMEITEEEIEKMIEELEEEFDVREEPMEPLKATRKTPPDPEKHKEGEKRTEEEWKKYWREVEYRSKKAEWERYQKFEADKKAVARKRLEERIGEPDPWDIVPVPKGSPDFFIPWKGGYKLLRMLHSIPIVGRSVEWVGGVRWLGIPKIHEVHTDRFIWSSLEFDEGSGKVVLKPDGDEEMTHVYVKQDVYGVFLSKAETRELVPTDSILALTMAVRNPYKARFRIEKWLESISNQLSSRIREEVGKHTFPELIGRASSSDEREAVASAYLRWILKDDIERIRRDYGVVIRKVQIFETNPGGEKADFYRELSTREWEGQREADKIREISMAKEKDLERTVGEILRLFGKGHEDEAAEVAKFVTMSGLTTYVEGDRSGNRSKKGRKAVATVPAT